MMNEIILKMSGVTKIFPGVVALDNVNFNIYRGKVMALLGENGAGKSTLMKILTGVYKKTKGEIYLNDELIEIHNPRDAQIKKISIIHQELNLIEDLSVYENIFLGREIKKPIKTIDREAMYSASKEILEMLNVDIDPKTKVSQLSIGRKQMVEIAKSLSLDAEIIVMDEPTAALTDKETEALFKVIMQLREKGKSIVYISHRLNEIFEICDMVTVLRDGGFISENSVKDIDEDVLIEKMVGRKLEEQFPHIEGKIEESLLTVRNLSNEYIKDISFELKKGEILGIAGLMGAGRTELGKTLYGAYKLKEGEILLGGETIRYKNTKEAIECGITYVSEDRKKDGLVLELSVKDNISLSSLKKLSRFSMINKKLEDEKIDYLVKKLSIKTPSNNQIIKKLSGGNQQKAAIAKSLLANPKVLILDEPTRGVDVGAKKEIYDLINEFKKKEMGLIFISSEIPELIGMCDRVLVMHENKIAGILNKAEFSQEKIMKFAVGLQEEA